MRAMPHLRKGESGALVIKGDTKEAAIQGIGQHWETGTCVIFQSSVLCGHPFTSQSLIVSIMYSDEVTRHHYYLQLRHNVVCRGLLHACATEEVLYLLAGYALQADLGDFVEDAHCGAYFRPAEYFPQQMLCSKQQILVTVPSLHRDNHGINKAEAELQYIREASSAEVSPLTHNSHLYRLKHKKQEAGPGSVFLSICAKGIEIYEKFEIRADNWPTSGEKYTYYTTSDEKSKHLLFLCRVTHQFSMAIQPRLSEVRRKEEEEKKRYRDCYMYSRGLSALAGKHYKCHVGDQRISVISNTSSNTTSGIVSDRVHSLDESEDDLEDMEIMINSPPAPSVESLALAHLRDVPPSCESQEVSRRRASTSSSLELGYSHTAQNSAVSDTASTTCVELDYSVQSAQTSSGIYTLRSSCATTTDTNACSSETSGVYVGCSTGSVANTSSNSHHGSYNISNTSLSDGIRDRSNSCAGSTVSASGSFRGDGSDPSDSGHRNLLTAEELSDLIVGRGSGSGHASGVYPSRSSVSATLDSDSDYVTLPPPPIPPPRMDSKPTNYAMLDPPSVHSPTPASVVSSNEGLNGSFPPSPHYTPRTLSQQNLLAQQLHSFSLESMTHNSSLEHMSQSQQALLSQQEALFSQPMMPQKTSAPLVTLPASVEEANARFITTKPHINILTAHTSLVPSTASPSFAAPTLAYQPVVSTCSPISSNSLQQLKVYPPGDARTHPPMHIKNIPAIPQHHVVSPRGSYMGYSQIHDSGSKMKPPSVHTLLPIIGKNNYLDVHASRNSANAAYLRSAVVMSQPPAPSSTYGGQQYHHRQFSPPPPPPVLHPRQPPPPPPSSNQPTLATVYTSQVTRSQIEQFQQQMYSDVDYVIYPMKDPAISKQEYMDAKQSSLIAHHAAMHYQQNKPYPPPPYPSYHSTTKTHLMYRSTPNVASLASGYHRPVSFANPMAASPIKYASNQNLSSDYFGYPSPYQSASQYSSSTSPLYSTGASYSSSSSRSLRYDQLPFSELMQLLPSTRARSDDNILNSSEKPFNLEPRKYRRLPPPPPPPPYNQQVQEKIQPKLKAAVSLECPKKHAGNENNGDGILDIRTLQEKSKNLDLPLISALCNDRSLLKQTNAFVMPKHPPGKQSSSIVKRAERPTSWHRESDSKPSSTMEGKTISSSKTEMTDGGAGGGGVKTPPKSGTLLSSILANKSSSGGKVENHFGKPPNRTPDRDSNLNLPVIGSLVYCKSSVLDHVATKAAPRLTTRSGHILSEVKEGFGNQINLCRDRGLKPGPSAQKSDTLPPRPPAPNEKLDSEQFRKALSDIANIDLKDEDFQMLFMKINQTQGEFINWNDLVSHLLLEFQEKDTSVQTPELIQPISGFPRVFKSQHRHPIARISFQPALFPDRSYSYMDGKYLTVSHDGMIHYWSLDMERERTVYSAATELKVHPTWVTDLVCLPDVSIVCTSSTERDLRFYDTVAKQFQLRILITSLDYVVVCMHYYFSKNIDEESRLVLGDEGGNVIVFSFTTREKGPFYHKPGVDLTHIRYQQLVKGGLPSIKVFEFLNVHSDWVCQVSYYSSLHSFLSCAICPENSLYMRDDTGTKSQYTFRSSSGISCFNFSEESHLLVTGGPDCIVRVWNIFVSSKANCVFHGHHAAICHIVLQDAGQMIFSVSKDRCIKVWDLAQQSCVQVRVVMCSGFFYHRLGANILISL
uniref:FERM domain-containing protein n=1 Tax=Timema tahoe TaxID=61484 RepID=A0A7R9IPW1_9NEOP|nr:unnamed protein product [Timema tahoe]